VSLIPDGNVASYDGEEHGLGRDAEAMANPGMGLTAAQIEAYWQAVAQAVAANPQLGGRRQCYVQTDVTGRERVKALPMAEVPETFDPFGGLDFSLDLRVRSVVEKQREDKSEEDKSEQEKQQPQEKIEHYGVLEGVLKYAGQHDRGAHVLLVGKPGSGKTTALERLLVKGELIGGRLPVVIRLRDLDGNTADPVLAEVRRVLQRWGVACSPEAVEGLVADQLFLLLDGVNEIPTLGGDGLRRAVQRFRERFQGTPMVFTTRAINVGVDLGIGQKLEMEPLSGPQMEEFARLHLGEEQGQALLDQLGVRLREFAETPLLLSMFCDLFKQNQEVPRNLGLVFRKFVEWYEQRSYERQGTHRSLREMLGDSVYGQLPRFLQSLAFIMMPQDGNPKGLKLKISKKKAVDTFVKVLKDANEKDALTKATEYLDTLLKYHLIREVNSREVEFVHQLFQEYYAAEEFLDKLEDLPDSDLSNLTIQKHYFNLLDWSEALALVAGLLESEEEALRLVQLGLAVDLYWGARSAGEVLPEFQEETVGLVLGCEVPEVLRIELLGPTRSQAAIPSLRKALNSLDPLVRISAIKAISQFEYEIARPALQQASNDPDPLVRQVALQIILGIRFKEILPFLNKSLSSLNESLSSTDWQKFHKYPLSLHREISEIKLHIPKIRRFFSDYRKLSEEELPNLLNALKHHDSHVRHTVASKISELSLGEAVLLPLVEALENQDPYVRRVIVQQIGKIKSEVTLPTLIKAGADKDEDVCRIALKAIRQLSLQETDLPILLDVIKHDKSSIRQVVIEAIGKIGSQQSLPALLKVLDDPNKDEDVCRIALEAIRQLSLQETALPILLDVIKHDKSSIRQVVIEAIGKIGSQQSLPALLKVLDDPNEDKDSDVRKQAAEAIGQIGNETVLPTLWQHHLKTPENCIKQAIQTLQNKNKRYNYPISQTPLPASPDHSTSNVTISGGSFGDLILGDKKIIIQNRD
jgi:HEAT repeat protein